MKTLTKHIMLVAIVAATTTVLAPTMATAQQFDEPPTMGQMFSNLNPMNWRMPKMPTFKTLMPETERAAVRKKKDGFFGELGKSASNTWTRTKQAFNPQKLNPTRFMPASARTPSEVPEKRKPGFFSSLWAAPPEPEKPSSVSEWMSQPRP